MNFFKLSRSNYIVAFICLTALNVLLLSILAYSVYAQVFDETISNQPPIVVEVIKQKDCPIAISVINVDNSALSFQRVNLSLQNTSSKNIKAYALVGQAGSTGKLVTTSPATKLFAGGEFHENEISLERKAIKEKAKLLLSIDYVLFNDGTSWGSDSQGLSKKIAGENAGRLAAIKEIRNVIAARNQTEIEELLVKNIVDIIVTIPDSSQSDEWKKGFQTGYKAVFSIIQEYREGGGAALLSKLNEMEKFAVEVKQ